MRNNESVSVKDNVGIEDGPENYDDAEEETKNWDDRKKRLRKYVPIISWLPLYSRFQAVSDIIAGITLGLTMIPQSIAYASLAGLTAKYGLYSSFIGGFIYVIFGTIKEVSIGPTSLMALASLSYARDLPPDFIVLLCFITGCVQLVLGLLNLGFLTDFISMPVTSGFTSATSIIIIASQLRHLFGIKYKSGNVIDTITKLYQNFGDAKLSDTILGLSSIIFLLALRKLSAIDCSRLKGSRGDHVRGLMMEKLFWGLSIGRNAIAVLITSVIAYYLTVDGQTPFQTAGKVQSGLPRLAVPPFSVQVGNQTYGFVDMCRQLNIGLIVTPLIGILTNVAIAKAFVHDTPVAATQEMLTLGMCNLSGSFFSSMPTCGAFTRSAVSSASGIQTPMAGLYSGTMALLALSFLTPYFGYIPKATLGAILICAVLFLVDLKLLKILWSGSKRDGFIAASTLIVGIVFDVGMGLFVGTALNAAVLLYSSARPSVEVSCRRTVAGNPYLVIKPEAGLFYPAVDFLGSRITQVASQLGKGITPIVVDFERLQGIDYTASKGIERLLFCFEKREQKLFFLNVNPRVKKTIFKLCGNLKTFVPIDSEGALIDILESKLSKSPTVPILAVSDEKEIQLENVTTKIVEKESEPEEQVSLLENREGTEKINEKA